jgi:uncharacterized peroxidase-related enzyme
VEDWRTAGLDDPTTALLEFGHRLTVEPSSISRADVEELRRHGFIDEGITTAVEVIAFFNFINRIAHGLGVQMEDWLDEHGRPL